MSPKLSNRFLSKASFLMLLIFALTFWSCTQSSDINNATYKNPSPDVFIKNWMLLGPIGVSDSVNEPDESIQKKAFEDTNIIAENFLPGAILSSHKINNKEYNWKLHKSVDNIIDLGGFYGDTNFVYAYALAEFELAKKQTMLLGIGSDDAIKIWVNGKKVHENFVGRATTIDADLIEVDFEKGKNQILLKVQNFESDWGFCLRPIGDKIVSELLCTAAERGDIDNIKMLLEYDPDFNYQSNNGLTAWQLAKVKGRNDVAELLKKNGAKENNNYPSIPDFVESSISSVIPNNSPAFALLIAQNGKVIYKNAFGYADIENSVEASVDTKFRIGSITKQFVATAILKLQEEGKINVQDKLSKYIPDFPRGDEVTIHHLLTHTSGIQSFTSRPDFADNVTKELDPKELVNSMKEWSFDFDPGEQIRYNNSGYFLLGEIIEIITGGWYGDYLKKVIFEPLKMHNTGVYINETPPTNEALGYTIEKGNYNLALNWHMSAAGGAGSLYSTVEDLFLWNEAVFNGKILSDESLKAAHTPVRLNNGEVAKAMPYGYGWAITNIRGEESISHGGGLPGFISYILRIPEENISIVTLTNTLPTMEKLNPSQSATEFAEYMIWNKLEPQESYTEMSDFDPQILYDYAGRYDYGNGMILTVTIEGEKLFAQMSGQPKHELYASKNDEFFWKVVEAKIKFTRDEDGLIKEATHYQGGNELVVYKLPDLISLPINKDLLEPYVGKYELQKDFYLNVSLNDQQQFFVQATGQPKLELYRISEDTYQAKEVNIKLRFYMNDDQATLDFEQGTIKKTMLKEK